MNYKRIIKSAKLRKMILDLLCFIPDKTMIRFQYYVKTGRRLNLKKPSRFTEKLQWYKLFYRNSIMKQCVDKFLVRQYVEERGLSEILVPLLGFYKNVDEIPFEKLPNSFVLKTTNGGGGLNVIVCKDKASLDLKLVKEKLVSKKVRRGSLGREWAYYGLNPGIVVEQLLINKKSPDSGINDYKFFCYGGEPTYVVADVDRYIGHKRNFYDIQWNNLGVLSDCPQASSDIEKPKNYDKMVDIARKLSAGFPFVRVDLYNCEGQIYFGELTFYPWSGYVQFYPDSADFLFGDNFPLEKYESSTLT